MVASMCSFSMILKIPAAALVRTDCTLWSFVFSLFTTLSSFPTCLCISSSFRRGAMMALQFSKKFNLSFCQVSYLALARWIYSLLKVSLLVCLAPGGPWSHPRSVQHQSCSVLHVSRHPWWNRHTYVTHRIGFTAIQVHRATAKLLATSERVAIQLLHCGHWPSNLCFALALPGHIEITS